MALTMQRNIGRMFAYILAQSGLENLPSDRHILHGVVSNLAKQDAYQQLLVDFEFSTQDIFPFSRELENVLNSLHLGKILTARNPEYSCFVINSGLVDKERTREIFGHDVATLDHLAIDFAAKVKEMAPQTS